MGLMLGHQAQQKRLLELAQQLVDEDGASQDLKDAAKAWIDSVNDAALSKEASKTFVVELEKSDLAAAKEILAPPCCGFHDGSAHRDRRGSHG